AESLLYTKNMKKSSKYTAPASIYLQTAKNRGQKRKGTVPKGGPFRRYRQKRCTLAMTAEKTMETVEQSLIRMLRLGPEVSLKGSPTVSPMTPALWHSLPLPPWWPAS